MNIVSNRLVNQHLQGKRFATPEEAVLYFGAIQSQDFPAAKWALGQRIKNATDQSVEHSFNEGKILRTHVMRPTWHFIHPKDIRWMLRLTSPRVKAFMGHYNRKLELTDEVFAKSQKVIVKTLKENTYLTRQELKTELNRIGITTDVQRLAHIIMWAELDGIICSGPRRGKQFTYALLHDRVPKEKEISRDVAAATLAHTYFTSHGPAQLKDFVWWSGLLSKDATEALDSIKAKLQSETINDKLYWFSKNGKITNTVTPNAFLLSIFDEYTIAYKDRSDLSEKRDIERMFTMGNALTAVVILQGKVAGTWKKTITKTDITIRLDLFRKIDKNEKEALESAVKDYGKFHELPVKLI